MQNKYEKLVEARALLAEAIALLDETRAPADIAARTDHALASLDKYLGEKVALDEAARRPH